MVTQVARAAMQDDVRYETMDVEMRPTGPAYAELEIDLARVGARAFQLELRFTDPEEPGVGAERDEGE